MVLALLLCSTARSGRVQVEVKRGRSVETTTFSRGKTGTTVTSKRRTWRTTPALGGNVRKKSHRFAKRMRNADFRASRRGNDIEISLPRLELTTVLLSGGRTQVTQRAVESVYQLGQRLPLRLAEASRMFPPELLEQFDRALPGLDWAYGPRSYERLYSERGLVQSFLPSDRIRIVDTVSDIGFAPDDYGIDPLTGAASTDQPSAMLRSGAAWLYRSVSVSRVLQPGERLSAERRVSGWHPRVVRAIWGGGVE